MKFRAISQLFGKHKKRSNKHTGTKMLRVSEGSYKTVRATAREYGMTYIAGEDLICAKAIEKLVEEQQQKALTPQQMQLYVAKTVIELGLKAKADRLAATPKKESPGETPGAVSH